MYQLRAYQEEMIAATMAAIPSDQWILIQAATGAGKTIWFAELTKRLLTQWPSIRIGILAHRSLLINQAADKLKKVWPGAPIGIACASTGIAVDTDRPVVIGSVQTLVKRLETTAPFDVMFLDEAHRLPPKNEQSQYRDFFETMLRYNPDTRIIGLTATPFRLGHGYIYGPICKPGNKNWFDRLNYKIGIMDLQNKGFLCQYRAKEAVDISRDLSSVKVTGEFNLGELSDVMIREIHVGSAVKALKEHASDRKRVIVFAVSIVHAIRLAEAFQESGVRAETIHSELSQDVRNHRLKKFQAGEIRVIVNVGILTEGFDEPSTDCLICCRPTKSPALHVQICGRGLRQHPGKTDVLILDLANNFRTHGDIDSPRVEVRGKSSDVIGEAPTKSCPECKELVAVSSNECPECGYTWPPPVEINRSQEMRDINFKKRPDPIEVEVIHFDVEDYTSKAGNRMVKIGIRCKQNGSMVPLFVNHFLMFDPDAHPFAIGKSQWWWNNIVGSSAPGSTEEAMEMEDAIFESFPRTIRIVEDGKWWKVCDWMIETNKKKEEVPF